MNASVKWGGSCIAVAMATFACASAPPRPPAYEPKFSYATAPSKEKADVTIGIIAPQFVGDGLEYLKSNKDDPVVKDMLRGIRTGFNEMLLAKGFNASGPFDSLDGMSFPEKKGADFVLYPEFDLSKGYVIGQARTDQQLTLLGPKVVVLCDFTIHAKGMVSFVALEPLSKEKMWIKRLEIDIPPERLQGTDRVCSGEAATREIRDAWAKAHEAMFNQLMASVDKYVNADEFKNLKRQAAELRAKKVY